VHVDDVVEANVLAESASREGALDKGRAHVFNVGAGRSWSFNEMVAELNGALSTSLEPDYFKNPFAFTQDHTETDVSLAGEHLGWRPALDLKAGLARYAQSGELGVPRA